MGAQDENLVIDITKAPDEQVSPMDEVINVTGEVTPPSVDDTEVEVEDTIPQAKKGNSNKSNFKKMSKSIKEKDARIAELEAAASKKAPEVEEDDDEDELSYDKVDLLEFITDNEWAVQYKEQMKELLDEFPNMTFERALNFAKAQEPEESKSHTMFNTKSTTAPKTKKLSDLTHEEAANANLSPAQFDAWSKSQRDDVNPFG